MSMSAVSAWIWRNTKFECNIRRNSFTNHWWFLCCMTIFTRLNQISDEFTVEVQLLTSAISWTSFGSTYGSWWSGHLVDWKFKLVKSMLVTDVGDTYKMLVTVLTILVTKSQPTISSPTLSRQYHNVINITVTVQMSSLNASKSLTVMFF